MRLRAVFTFFTLKRVFANGEPGLVSALLVAYGTQRRLEAKIGVRSILTELSNR
ncbi:hypothetical protein D3C76_1877860 [compost metagenome]